MPPAAVSDIAAAWTAAAPPYASAATEAAAKDAIIAWFRGEFAAANAIIDSLCGHLARLGGGGGSAAEYEAVFAAVHRRRMNWIPVLQMQKYYSIADVAVELRRVTERREKEREEREGEGGGDHGEEKNVLEGSGEEGADVADEESVRNVSDDAPESEITDTGSHEEVHPTSEESIDLCSNHEECDSRVDQMKMTKGFIAKEHVKGRMVNVVRGLKLYDDIFTDCELSKLNDYVIELRVAGQKGELSGETYILYNQQMKGKKRELLQFGAPIFEHVKEETTEHEKGYIEPIPALLQGIIDHLVRWHLISETRKPNSCILNFFDEGEFSQPFLKPPHLEQPISTLVLSESTMAFGRTLVSDNDGNYKGPLMLPLNKGSVLVMRGNSSDMTRHAMCASPNKRVSITFFRVRQEINQINNSIIPHSTRAMTLWQPSTPTSYAIPNGNFNGGEIIDLSPKWGLIRTPVIMLAPAQPIIMSPRNIPQEGTGVFLPWSGGQRKPARRLPPRAQKRQMLSLSSAYEMESEEHTTNQEMKSEV